MSYEKKEVWSVLLRLYHWSFVGSIVVLTVTGLYINTPWTNTMLEGSQSFPMATMRYYHFLAAYVFSGAFAIRIYLLLFGNKQERILSFAPITPKNIKDLWQELLYYLYINRKGHVGVGHNSLGGGIFMLIFTLAALQLISGFYMLYPENLTWELWGVTLFNSQQQARYFHHLTMWAFLFFATIHIYMVIWNDIKGRDGLISSIFTGDKFKKKCL